MQVGAEHLAIGTQRAVTAAIIQAYSSVQTDARADPGMNLVTADRNILQAQLAAYIAQLLFRLKYCGECQ